MIGQPPLLTAADGIPAGAEEAILLIDKPRGTTSFTVVRQVRRLFGVKRVGHAGTLDPMATGLLIVLVGRKATRLQDEFMGLPKVYSGTMRLGETTPSYDAETEVLERRDPAGVTADALESVRQRFLGEISQQPPMYSAIKVGGERLYKKARRGEEVERKPRTVRIDRFEISSFRKPDVDFLVGCSKGTYIRSLAHDFGQELGVGAHLTALRRLAIGDFSVEDAWSVPRLASELSESRGVA